MMKAQIFYFSGTGNSLYIARELQKKLPKSTLVSMSNKANLSDIKSETNLVGFVFPVHAFTLPIPVKSFLESLNLDSASYIFAVATRGGSPCNVFLDINKILKKKGKYLDAEFFLDMPNSFTHIAKTPTQEDIIKLNTNALKKLERVASIVSDQKKHNEDKLNKSLWRRRILFPIVSTFLHKTDYLHTDKKFYAGSNCIKCGLCSEICLSNKIRMNDGKPIWRADKKCVFCFACLNYCPCKAIQIRNSKSLERGRYHHPEITANDIKVQK